MIENSLLDELLASAPSDACPTQDALLLVRFRSALIQLAADRDTQSQTASRYERALQKMTEIAMSRFNQSSVDEMLSEAAQLHTAEIARVDGLLARERERSRKLNIVVNAAKRWSHARDHIPIDQWSSREIDLQYALMMREGGEPPKHWPIHWPDCALNHGGEECDMGDECGQPAESPQPDKEHGR